jgi:hypothetical protein
VEISASCKKKFFEVTVYSSGKKENSAVVLIEKKF